MTEPSAWIAGPNPFNLPPPPEGFLRLLVAYDRDLVIFPSREEPVYRLARRVHGRVPTAYQFLAHRPDTAIFSRYGLVPVTSIRREVGWSPLILQELADRDLQRAGGGLAAAQRLEAWEDAARDRAHQRTRDDAAEIAGFAWRSWKWRTGQTIDLAGRHPRHVGGRARVVARRPADRPIGGQGGFVADTPARNEAARGGGRGVAP